MKFFHVTVLMQIERSELLSRIANFEAEAISRHGNEESVARKLQNQLESVQNELESLKQMSSSQLASKDSVIAQLEAKLAAQQIELDRQRALAEDRELAGRQSYQRLQERIEALLSSAETSAPLLMLDSCKRCGTEFREIENGPSACSFHSGKRVTNAVGYRFWSCCLQEYSKSNPAPPCERGRHTAESKTPSA
jgi:vacuolar-type H+-ATPase subunit I/STV1